MISNQNICYLLMNESQRRELLKANSQLFFKGYMTKNLHESESLSAALKNLIEEKGDSNPRNVLIVLQQLDESIGIKQEISESKDQILKEVLLKDFTTKTLNSIEKIKELGILEKYENSLIEHLEQMNELLC